MVLERGEWHFRLSALFGNNSEVLDILPTPEIFFFFLLCVLPSSGKGSACSSTLQ